MILVKLVSAVHKLIEWIVIELHMFVCSAQRVGKAVTYKFSLISCWKIKFIMRLLNCLYCLAKSSLMESLAISVKVCYS